MSWPTFVCASSYSIAALLVAKLTPADVTPPAPVSASRTVAAQLAQVMPSMGRTMRALLMGPPPPPPPSTVELVRRRCGAAIAGWLHDQKSLQHVHAAAEGILTRLIGRELDGGGLKRRELLVDPEALEHHTLRAVRGFVAIKLEPHRLAGLHDDRIGGVPTFHRDAHFLDSLRAGGRGHRLSPGEEEGTQHPDHGSRPQRPGDDLSGRAHDSAGALAHLRARGSRFGPHGVEGAPHQHEGDDEERAPED